MFYSLTKTKLLVAKFVGTALKDLLSWVGITNLIVHVIVSLRSTADQYKNAAICFASNLFLNPNLQFNHSILQFKLAVIKFKRSIRQSN